jgi:hypothetical protein
VAGDPKLPLARSSWLSTLYRVENGLVNLVAVVAFLIVAIGLVPMVLYLGSPRKRAGAGQPNRK